LLAGTIEFVKLRTRQFAKWQLMWFRGQMELEWIELKSAEATAEVTERIISHSTIAKDAKTTKK
jgi:tRNA A37 N6-isopentenylltransferase MiaA